MLMKKTPRSYHGFLADFMKQKGFKGIWGRVLRGYGGGFLLDKGKSEVRNRKFGSQIFYGFH